MENLKQFIIDAKDFYYHKTKKSLDTLSQYSNDPFDVYHNYLHKNIIQIIQESGKYEYGVDLHLESLLNNLLYHQFSYYRSTWRYKGDKERTKFRQPKFNKIPKKEKKLKEKKYSKDNRKTWQRSSKKYYKKYGAKAHRNWAKREINYYLENIHKHPDDLENQKERFLFTKNNREYKKFVNPWWWD